MTTKDTIYEIVKKHYNETHFPNMTKVEIQRMVGSSDISGALNELLDDNIIRPDVGINGVLVIYVPGEAEYEETIKTSLQKLKTQYGKRNSRPNNKG